jgi:hypothetical protein
VVFDFLADGTNNPTWQPSVVDVAGDEAAPGMGARYRQSVRHPLDDRPRGWMTLVTPLMPLVNLLFRWQTSWLRNAKTTLEARSPEPAAG